MNANPSGAQTMLGETEYATRLGLLQRARAGDSVALQELATRYHVRIGGLVPRETSCDTVKRGGTMDDKGMATCEICQASVKAKGLGVHKARAHRIAGMQPGAQCPYCHEAKANPHEHMRHCPKRTGNGVEASVDSARRIKPPIKPATPKVQPSAAVSEGNGCADCLFRGLNRHVDQALVEEAVRGGMCLTAAAAFVRRVLETR